ncbi:tyrosine-type recombinase/integrase [Clostridium estertheticum]|uniref:Tyrosine-type recombinase/integrase n=1 Tax=Clostridium estertheticum TaxID=238834 RepID=A0AA47ELM5_9CLOT|nr:tyrosine-type recombinase/integrase [Clostridium estertheticum]MBU3155243.1 tyrosine-type recombinase/integrase [Clostridium estertheticum]WAG61296.1 tyrosine-type recombinase/integrase [Clostridium estertheticum]
MQKIEYIIDEFMNYCQSKILSQKTMMSYEQTLRLFSKYLQEEKNIEDVNKITEKDIREYVVYIKNRGKYTVVIDKKTLKGNIPEARGDYGKQVSITTVNNYIRNIKVFFNYSKEQGVIKKDVVKNIKQFKNERKPKQFITDKEFGELLRHIDTTKFHEYRDYICVMLLLDSGMRISECLAIKVEDIDINNRAILLKSENTKGRKSRYVYFSPIMQKELRRWLQYKDRYVESDVLFCSTKGNIVMMRTFEKKLKDYGLRIGLKDITPHQLRNNFAKRFLMAGGSIYTLSQILGHSSVKITESAYLDLTDDDIRKTYQAFSPLENMRKAGK